MDLRLLAVKLSMHRHLKMTSMLLVYFVLVVITLSKGIYILPCFSIVLSMSHSMKYLGYILYTTSIYTIVLREVSVAV